MCPKKIRDNTPPVTIKGLIPGKTYTVALVTDDYVECIKAPCDPVSTRIAEAEFTTIKKTAAIVLALDITDVASTTETVSLNELTRSGLSVNEAARIHFTYKEANIICKKDCAMATNKGLTASLANLKPGTTYKVRAVKDSSVQCITAPCLTNFVYGDEFTFTTLGTPSAYITRLLHIGSTGSEVTSLQTFLAAKGFMTATPTGYFGLATMKALKASQKSVDLPPTGSTGPRTRVAINNAK